MNWFEQLLRILKLILAKAEQIEKQQRQILSNQVQLIAGQVILVEGQNSIQNALATQEQQISEILANLIAPIPEVEGFTVEVTENVV